VELVAPVWQLSAHVTALGMRFYDRTAFPVAYRHQIFLAEHCSWNRSSKVGYRVRVVRLENGNAVAYEPFARGRAAGETGWGCPADDMVAPDAGCW
jgi:glucose/arabinose dehydrogenase